MAGKRLDALVARDYVQNGETKTAWTKIGAAFESQGGWSIQLDALPIASLDKDGKITCRIILREPREREQQRGPF